MNKLAGFTTELQRSLRRCETTEGTSSGFFCLSIESFFYNYYKALRDLSFLRDLSGSVVKLLLCFMFASTLSAATPQEEAKQAFLLYREGEAAKDVKERREAFNGALKLYSQLSETGCSGILFYNLGNSYFQLGEYPWSILYYERAARLLPREKVIQQNLATAQKKLGLEDTAAASWITLSLKERWTLFSAFVIALYLTLSVFLLFRWKFLRLTSYVLGVLLFAILLSIGWSWYVEPLRAVVIENNLVFPAGSTVKVIREQEGFVEVESGGRKGVLTSQQLRLVL